MKISNEMKVGVLTIVALLLLILGFNFLKGNNVFSKNKRLYAVFFDIGSLDKSNAVKIRGLEVGSVYAIDATNKNVDGLAIASNWTKDINIKVNSSASIVAPFVRFTYIHIEMA